MLSWPTDDDRASTVTTSDSLWWSSTTSTVINLVIDAIARCSFGFEAASTCPVSFSTTQASASTRGGEAVAELAA